MATCLVGAYLIAYREPIMAVDHPGVATVICITGLGLIGTGNTLSFVCKKGEEQ